MLEWIMGLVGSDLISLYIGIQVGLWAAHTNRRWNTPDDPEMYH